jgi:hypothetical protein
MLLGASSAITRMLAPQSGQHLAANAQRQRRQGLPAATMARQHLSASALSDPEPPSSPAVRKRRDDYISTRGLRVI